MKACIPLFKLLMAALLFVLHMQRAQGTEEGFVTLFNGKDLSGWVPVNVAPGTFTVREGMIISTGKPTGVMRTEQMY